MVQLKEQALSILKDLIASFNTTMVQLKGFANGAAKSCTSVSIQLWFN